MAIDASFKNKEDYIELKLSGSRDINDELNESIKILNSIADTCNKHNLDKIIVLLYIDRPIRTDKMPQFTEAMQNSGLKPSVKIALVATTDKLYGDVYIVETFLKNSGLNCSIFRTKQEAQKWIYK